MQALRKNFFHRDGDRLTTLQVKKVFPRRPQFLHMGGREKTPDNTGENHKFSKPLLKLGLVSE